MNPVHFSSASDNWSTPQDLFDRLNAAWGFKIDVCASRENAKCPAYYTREDNGLAGDWTRWGGPAWMNPPYGRGIGAWVEKAARTADAGTLVVCLLPARTDTAWWHDWIQPILNRERPGRVAFIRGRLKFGGHKNSAPFPSVIVEFWPAERP